MVKEEGYGCGQYGFGSFESIEYIVPCQPRIVPCPTSRSAQSHAFTAIASQFQELK